MNIAIAGILTRPISPQTHGGTEAVTYELIEGLVRRGHQVTLYGASDSRTSASLVSVCSSQEARIASMNSSLAQPYSLLLARKLAEDSSRYDIIHNNMFHHYIIASLMPFIKSQVVHTIHNSFYTNLDWCRALKSFNITSGEHYVFVSEYARKQADIASSQVIHNGVDADLYSFDPRGGDPILWLGRMVPEKGADIAIQVAETVGKPLTLATVPVDARNNVYLRRVVRPMLTARVTLNMSRQVRKKIELYQQSRAVLFPVTWEEPFGLVMIEAMACGTPVIAFARGAVPEIVADGETGFIVNPSDTDRRGAWMTRESGMKGLQTALERVYTMSSREYEKMRKACRRRVMERFTIGHMIDGYESLYKTLI